MAVQAMHVRTGAIGSAHRVGSALGAHRFVDRHPVPKADIALPLLDLAGINAPGKVQSRNVRPRPGGSLHVVRRESTLST